MPSGRSRFCFSALGLALGLVALLAWAALVWSPSGDPRVHGKRWSEWLTLLGEKYWMTDYRNPPFNAEMERALSAFASQREDAGAWLLDQMMPPGRGSVVDRLRSWVRRWTRPRFRPADAFRFDGFAQDRLLAWLEIPGPRLVALLEPRLASADLTTRNRAIRVLGRVGPDPGPAIERLRVYLGGTDFSALDPAVRAAGDLGARAEALAPELVERVRSGRFPPGILRALGHCGPKAEGAVTALEAGWKQAASGIERVEFAVALARIRPDHADALRELEMWARGGGEPGPARAKPIEVVRTLGEISAPGPQFLPVFRAALGTADDDGGSVPHVAAELICRVDPAEGEGWFRSRIQSAPDHRQAVERAVELQIVLPTNAVALSVLRAALVSNGPPAALAAAALFRSGDRPDVTLTEGRRLAGSAVLDADLRAPLQAWVEWRSRSGRTATR